MKSKNISILLLCLVFTLCIFLQTGCGNDAGNNVEVIRFWHSFTGKQKSIFDMLVDTYNTTEGKKRNVIISPEHKDEAFIIKYFNENFDLKEKAKDYPEMVMMSSELAYKAKSLNLPVNAEKYLSSEELDGYFDAFLQEGRITGTNETYIFPLCKSSAVTIINDSLWKNFSIICNTKLNQLNTWQGLLSVCEKYYNWSNGKAFFAIESLEDFIFAFSAQHLPAMIQAGNKEVKINTNKEMLRAMWEVYYIGVVNGYISQEENVIEALEKGDIVAYLGEPHDSSFFPSVYTNALGEEKNLLLTASTYPVINESRRVAPHSGLGVCVLDRGDKLNKECFYFLHWLCTSENSIQFSAANNQISSYEPLYEKSSSKDYFKQLSVLNYEKYYMLTKSISQVTQGQTYAPTGFVGYESFCKEVTSSLFDISQKGLNEVKKLEQEGLSHAEAIETVCTESVFEEWYIIVMGIVDRY